MDDGYDWGRGEGGRGGSGGEDAYVRSGSVTLEVGLDGLVLLVELSEIGDEVLDDVGVRKRVDARLGLCVGGDTACWWWRTD